MVHLLNKLHLYEASQLRAGGVVRQQELHAVVGDLHRHSPVHRVSDKHRGRGVIARSPRVWGAT